MQVAVSNNGTIFVSDGYCNSRVAQFSPLGEHQGDFVLDNGAMQVPHSVVLQECSDSVLVADRENSKVHQFELSTRSFKGTFCAQKVRRNCTQQSQINQQSAHAQCLSSCEKGGLLEFQWEFLSCSILGPHSRGSGVWSNTRAIWNCFRCCLGQGPPRKWPVSAGFTPWQTRQVSIGALLHRALLSCLFELKAAHSGREEFFSALSFASPSLCACNILTLLQYKLQWQHRKMLDQ